MMAKFLILNSTNPSNIGTIGTYSENFTSNDVFKLDSETEKAYAEMSKRDKDYFIAELRKANGVDEKKNVVGAVIKQIESELDKNIEVDNDPFDVYKNDTPNETEETFNEPINEVELIDLKDEFAPVVDEIINNVVANIIKPKGRPKKETK